MYTVEFYLTTKNNEILTDRGKWMEREIIMIKRNQSQEDKYHVFLPICKVLL